MTIGDDILFDITSASSMPLITPLYPPLPFWFEEKKQGLVIFNLEKDTLRPVVPKPLRVAGTPNAFVFVSQSSRSCFGPVMEAGLLVAVKCRDWSGLYCPIMYTDSLPAMCAYREQLGLPAKYATISMVMRDNKIKTKVQTGELTLIEVELYCFEPVDPEPDTPRCGHRVIPALDGTRALDEVVRFEAPWEEKTSYVGTAKMELGYDEADPLAYFMPRYVLGGSRHEYQRQIFTTPSTIV